MPHCNSRNEKRFIRRRQEREKYCLVANLNGCRFQIVKHIIEEAGFKIEEGEDSKSAFVNLDV